MFTFESHYCLNIISKSPFNIQIVSEIWGDGFRTGNEKWDDGGKKAGDGWDIHEVEAQIKFNTISTYWDEICQIETGWACTFGSPWTVIWGDGIIIINKEEWDDKNTTPNDGCSSDCKTENGYNWAPVSPDTFSTWTAICGDGLVVGSEQWDDKNTTPNYGCSSDCKTELGYSWLYDSFALQSLCTSKWGDQVKAFNEECDITDTTETGMKEGGRVIVITDKEHNTQRMETSIQANRMVITKGKEKLTTRTELNIRDTGMERWLF